MSHRLFEGVAHVDQYIKFRPHYPAELFQKIMSFLKEKRPTPHQLYVDVGCGSGQGTYGLSSQFDRVIGFDVSKSQIDAANKANTATNVEFKVSTAEKLPLEDNSADLVTCAQAVHWFDFEAFCKECRRVLKPNGCLAIVNYANVLLEHKDSNVNKKLEEYFDEIYEKELDSFWDERRRLVENKLPGYKIPFPDFVRDDSMEIRYSWSVSHYIGYVRSWSAYQKYKEANPSGQIMEEYYKKIMAAIASPEASPEETYVDAAFPITLLLGRV